jgi:hypothetical protein
MYTHQNPDLLVASKIEQERAKDIVQVRLASVWLRNPGSLVPQKSRRKPKKSDVGEGSPGKAWPPPRIHKKNKQTAVPRYVVLC